MIHYTLNTGHSRLSPRAEVSEEAIAALRPVAQNGLWPVPGPMPLAVTISRTSGYAAISLLIGHATPVPGLLTEEEVAKAWRAQRLYLAVSCGLAWTDAGARQFWPQLEQNYLTLLANDPQAPLLGNADPERPSTVPWLAVLLLSTIGALSRDEAMTLADLERCLAWTILEDQTKG